MRTTFLILVLIFCGMNLSAQKKMNGIGGELSALGLKPTYRMWFSKTTGIDLFAGVSAEFRDFKPNDYEAGVKYLHTFQYSQTNRSYLGAMGKWTRATPQSYNATFQLPVFGALIGREWYIKRASWKGFSVELGYQFGKKSEKVRISPFETVNVDYEEFPFIVNLRYSFYKRP